MCISLLSFGLAQAQDRNDAVVYIQGDKETPIYVKMEGQMMERYSKNYFILNGLAGGALHIQILFQQNKYPAQNFILNIPPSIQRSFTLQKVGENSFALYDLNYGVTIPAGNKLEDDIDLSNRQVVILEVPSVKKVQENTEIPKENKKNKVKKSNREEELPAFKVSKENEETNSSKEVKKVKTKEKEQVAETVKSKDSADRFLGFELDKSEKDKNKDNKGIENSKSSETSCNTAISDYQFKNLLTRLSGYDDVEKKLKYLKSQSKYNCYSSAQVEEIAADFKDQSSRYVVVKSLKERVVDPEEYKNLDSLFNTNYLKKKFLNEVAK